jgi:HEPN domain-containing protein
LLLIKGLNAPLFYDEFWLEQRSRGVTMKLGTIQDRKRSLEEELDRIDRQLFRQACYHAQQSVEKVLK